MKECLHFEELKHDKIVQAVKYIIEKSRLQLKNYT